MHVSLSIVILHIHMDISTAYTLGYFIFYIRETLYILKIITVFLLYFSNSTVTILNILGEYCLLVIKLVYLYS